MKWLNELGSHADSGCKKRFHQESDRRSMQIKSATEAAMSIADWTGSTRQSNPASSSSATAASQTARAYSSATTTPAGISSSSSQFQKSLSGGMLSMVAAPYSAVAGGKSYPGSVEESAGVYVASVPDPPGASASGATAQIAENNLEMKLDELA
jgi:hypothetical protein